MTFTENDKLKTLAIVHVFETSRPLGDYAAVAVLNDGAGVSYGINQFTHRSGSLAAVVEAYLNGGGKIGHEILTSTLPILRKTSVSAINKLAADAQFKTALRAAAVTREMKSTQREIAFARYLRPALDICDARKFALPLSLAVVYDSLTHGSWERVSAVIGRNVGAPSSEKAWITEYIRKRHIWLSSIPRLKVTTYRTRFFLNQIATGNWDLRMPLNVHGARLTNTMLNLEAASGSVPPAVAGGAFDAATREQPDAERPALERAGDLMGAAAAKFDRIDGAVTAVMTRKDAVKSLWTTILGTLWQAAWAVFGFLVGLPKAVWIVVAIIAGTLMLAYLYRQILLGKIREIRA